MEHFSSSYIEVLGVYDSVKTYSYSGADYDIMDIKEILTIIKKENHK